MELKYFVIKEEVQKLRVSIQHVSTDLMIDDPLTKGLLPKVFTGHVENMGIMCTSECWMVYVVSNAYLILWAHYFIVSKIYMFFCLMNVHASYDYDVENKLCYCWWNMTLCLNCHGFLIMKSY